VSKGANRGLAESVKQRLPNLSAVRGGTFNALLMRDGVERLLYRMSRSPHADAFVLKVAMLLAIWADKPHRPTQDLDLLGFGSPSTERLERGFREIRTNAVEPDGLAFDPVSVIARPHPRRRPRRRNPSERHSHARSPSSPRSSRPCSSSACPTAA
jgi:hypothetical protein